MFKLKFPFRMILAGSSGSGKSCLLADIIINRHVLIDKKIDRIIYCAKYATSMPKVLRNNNLIQFHEGLPDEEMVKNEDKKNVLICLDDLLETAFSSDLVSNLFTQGRNRNTSVVLLTQNLFPQFKHARNVSLNANYIIVFRNMRDRSSIGHLAKQVCPGNSRAFSDLFSNHINTPFSYLFLDFTQDVPDVFRYRTDILSDTPSIFTCAEELNNATTSKTTEAGAEIPSHLIELPEF